MDTGSVIGSTHFIVVCPLLSNVIGTTTFLPGSGSRTAVIGWLLGSTGATFFSDSF